MSGRTKKTITLRGLPYKAGKALTVENSKKRKRGEYKTLRVTFRTFLLSVLQNGHDIVVIQLTRFVLNRKPVDDGQNSAHTAGQQLENAHADVAEHEAVNTESAEEN